MSVILKVWAFLLERREFKLIKKEFLLKRNKIVKNEAKIEHNFDGI